MREAGGIKLGLFCSTRPFKSTLNRKGRKQCQSSHTNSLISQINKTRISQFHSRRGDFFNFHLWPARVCNLPSVSTKFSTPCVSYISLMQQQIRSKQQIELFMHAAPLLFEENASGKVNKVKKSFEIFATTAAAQDQLTRNESKKPDLVEKK